MMVKLKQFAYQYLPIIIAAVLVILPFIWIPHGKINIGGDSSRLYLLFPNEWLYNNLFAVNSFSTLYPYDPAFYLIPFIGTLAILKKLLFDDPFILNNFVTGLLLASSFLTARALFKEILKKYVDVDPYILSLGALAYVLSPLTIYEWYLALYYIFQLLAYPLIVLLFLEFVEKPKVYYLAAAAVVFFIFSMDFGFGNVAWVFAFFPITGLFLFYQAYQNNQVKKFILSGFLFILMFLFSNAFHLIPQAINAFETSSLAYKFLFDKQFYFERGMGFYRSIIERTRLSYNLYNQPPYLLATANNNPFSDLMYKWQVRQVLVSSIFFGIPILVLAFSNKLKNRKLNLLIVLTCLNFILLFLIAGNLGLWSHKVFEFLYRIPGFTMFRGYYHKFAFVSSFYRSLLFIYSLMLLKEINLNKRINTMLVVFSYFVVILNAMPLLTGAEFYQKFFHSDDVFYTTSIPDNYLNLVGRIQKEPLISRFSTFPLTYESYQAVKGSDNSAYIGPSFVAMVTNKGDTCGLASYQMFTDEVIKILESKDTKAFSDLLTKLNIGFIFYDSEEFTYSRLAKIPYTEQLTKYFPNQASVSNFLEKLNWSNIYKDSTYSIYFNRNSFIPRLSLKQPPTVSGSVNPPSIEFTRVDSTMYIAKTHQFSADDVITLNEIFNPNWHVFLLPIKNTSDYSNIKWNDLKVYNYGILPANLSDIKENYAKKLVTDLGDLQPHTDTIQIWKKGTNISKEKIDYTVNYISPNFNNTIQNDNLKQKLTVLDILKLQRSTPKLTGTSALVQQPSDIGLTEWKLNSKDICKANSDFCLKNPDGTYDYTVVIYYVPQTVFYVSSALTAVFLALMLIMGIASLVRSAFKVGVS